MRAETIYAPVCEWNPLIIDLLAVIVSSNTEDSLKLRSRLRGEISVIGSLGLMPRSAFISQLSIHYKNDIIPIRKYV